MTGAWPLAAPEAVACVRDVARARARAGAYAGDLGAHRGSMAASGRGGGVSIVEGAGGVAEAGRGYHDTDHQALDASDGVGGLRLLDRSGDGAGMPRCSDAQGKEIQRSQECLEVDQGLGEGDGAKMLALRANSIFEKTATTMLWTSSGLP